MSLGQWLTIPGVCSGVLGHEQGCGALGGGQGQAGLSVPQGRGSAEHFVYVT